MATKWKLVRIPVELDEELQALAARELELHWEGRIYLPTEFVEANFVPRWWIAQKGVEMIRDHRRRSNRPRRRTAASREGCKQGKESNG